MPRYPAATWRPITRNHGGPRRRTRAVVLHVDAGGAESLYGWFQNPAAQASSHFYVTYDGRVEQYLDTDLTAWTQRDGNASCIGIETQGRGDGKWTDAQLDAIVPLLAWVCDTHKIPRRDMGSSLPGASGIGIHRYGIAPYRHPAGETWGPRAKACPGEARVAQFPQIITRLTTQEDDMPTAPEVANAVLNTRDKALGGRSVHEYLAALPALAADASLNYKHPLLGTSIIGAQVQLLGRVAGLEAAVAAGSDLTEAQVREASRQGVADAIASIESETTLTVKGPSA